MTKRDTHNGIDWQQYAASLDHKRMAAGYLQAALDQLETNTDLHAAEWLALDALRALYKANGAKDRAMHQLPD